MTVAQLVSRERTRLGAALLARGAAIALAAAAVVIAAGTIALGDARWITRPGAPLAAWAVALVLAAIALWWTRRDVRRAADPAEIARAIERERSLRAGQLRGALEVAGSGALGARASELLARRLGEGGAPLAPAMHRRAVRHGLIAGAGALTALALLGAARAAAPDGWRALRHPVGALTGSLLAPLRFVDAPRVVLRGEKLRLQVLAPERRALTLHLRATGAAWDTLALPVRRGVATAVVGPLDADLAVVATDGRAASDTLVVRVTDRPFVGDVAIRATYPAYLDRPPETIPAGEPARVPRGTVLAISGRASTTLAQVGLARDRDTLRLDPDGHAFGGRVVARESGRWSWFAAGTRGAIPDLPQPLELDVIPDSAPRVEILDPTRDTTVLADAQVPLAVRAADDHGLSTIVLRSWRRMADGRVMPEVAQALASPHGAQWTGTTTLALAPRGLQPGDEVHLAVVATDDSPWRQTSTSGELVLHVPSLTEQRAQLRALADSSAARLATAAKTERQLAERTSEAARSRADRTVGGGNERVDEPAPDPRQSAMSYQSAEQARALAQRQQQLQQQVQQVQHDAQELERRMRAAGVMDSALVQQLRDVRKLLADALTPELQRQLAEVMKAAQKLSPDEMRKAMEHLAEQQQALREQLERSAEMLRRAALEGSMQTLHDEARDIAQAERRMSDSLARGSAGADSNAARRAGELSQRSRDLSKDVAQLAQRLAQEKAEAGPKRLAGASARADSSASAMQRAAPRDREGAARDSAQRTAARAANDSASAGEQRQGVQQQGAPQQGAPRQGAPQQGAPQQGAQPQRGQPGAQPRGGQAGAQATPQGAPRQGTGKSEGAQPESAGNRGDRAGAAQQAAQQMDRAAQQLGDARDAQIQEWKHDLTSQLDRSIQETMQLARQQESLAARARRGGDEGLRGDQSALQQGVQKAQERLEQAARQSAHVSQQSQATMADAARQVRAATQQTADAGARNSPQGAQQAAQSMDDAAKALDRAAAEMMKDRSRAASAQSASGFSEMIEQMRQAAKEQGSINAQSAGLLPIPGGQPSAQMMAQGRALAQRQRALADKVENAGGGDGGAQELAKQMRQIADALDRGRLDPSILARQQQLFHKLLDAGLTMEKDEREDTGKREAETARDDNVLTPANTTATGRAVLRYREPTWSELRGLTADERRAVLEYFKRINAEQDSTRPPRQP